MFKIEAEKKVTRPVTVSVPGDGNTSTKASFRWTFVILPKKENDELLANEDADNDEWLKTVNRGFSDVQDDSGEPMPSSEDNFARLINITYVRLAMIKCYFEAAAGGEAKRKN